MVNFCNILIQRNNIVNHTNEYTLGTVFMYNYYQIFDLQNNKFGLNGPSIDFAAARSSFPTWIIILVVGVMVIVGISIFCFIRIKNKRL